MGKKILFLFGFFVITDPIIKGDFTAPPEKTVSN
jgi:hypothetical protein